MTLSFLSLGFALGVQHALESDHVAAASMQVTKTNRIMNALSHGVLWGAGHAGVLLVLGGVLLFFQKEIPPFLTAFFEALVGMMLIILGVYAWRNKERNDEKKDKDSKKMRPRNGKKSFAIGSIHGLAGSSAVVILIAGTVTSVGKGLLFLLLFGLGGILSMILFSVLLSLPLQFLKQRKVLEVLPRVTALISVVMGVVVLVRVGSGMLA